MYASLTELLQLLFELWICILFLIEKIYWPTLYMSYVLFMWYKLSSTGAGIIGNSPATQFLHIFQNNNS